MDAIQSNLDGVISISLLFAWPIFVIVLLFQEFAFFQKYPSTFGRQFKIFWIGTMVLRIVLSLCALLLFLNELTTGFISAGFEYVIEALGLVDNFPWIVVSVLFMSIIWPSQQALRDTVFTEWIRKTELFGSGDIKVNWQLPELPVHTFLSDVPKKRVYTIYSLLRRADELKFRFRIILMIIVALIALEYSSVFLWREML